MDPGAPKLAAGVQRGMNDRERLLDELRPVAFAIAYRMLGSVSEAEDVAQEALLLDGQQQLISVLALDIAGGQITSIGGIANPDKLTHLGPVADHKSLLRSAR